MSNIQALLFPKSRYTVNKAKRWATSNGYHPLKYHVTDNYIRARIKHPDSSRYNYRTGHIANNIKAVYEQPRGGAIGSDLAVGTATVALPLLIYAAKKIYDKVSNKGGGYIGNLRYTSGRSRSLFDNIR